MVAYHNFMRILVVGAGAREHALAWKLRREPVVDEVLATPGNPGIGHEARLVGDGRTDPAALLALARAERPDLTVIGPEQPLADGVVDAFADAGLLAFGPTRAAARLETSKAFAKAFMERHRVPTARYEICADPDAALAAIDRLGPPVVVKADGLAAGKGVVVAYDRETAVRAIDAAMVAADFGDAGRTLVIEECLTGEEVSFFALCDGRRAVALGTAQDHKRAFDDDQGPNTGGMGAFAPSPLVGAAAAERIMQEIVAPVVAGLRAEGTPYRGVLYVGLMLTPGGPKVIEFNVRFGDPEAQVVLPGIDEELAPLLAAAAGGRLDAGTVRRSPRPRVGVVLASGGYPGPFERGKVISGLDEVASSDDVLVFHAGTRVEGGQVVTSGGRVLTVVGAGPTYDAAIQRAYDALGHLSFDGCRYRRDIGRKALAAPAAGGPR